MSAEAFLERCVARVAGNVHVDTCTGEVTAYPLPPHAILVEVGKALGFDPKNPQDLGDPGSVRAYLLVREAAKETLTTWWEGRGRTHAECLALFQDALFEARLGD